MYELRWCERKTGKKLQNEHGFYYDETVKVLQYRTQKQITDYSFIDPITKKYFSYAGWTSWKDVPTSIE